MSMFGDLLRQQVSLYVKANLTMNEAVFHLQDLIGTIDWNYDDDQLSAEKILDCAKYIRNNYDCSSGYYFDDKNKHLLIDWIEKNEI